ncbi:MAG: YihY/virulence factor BrkB family protein [Actinomycetota bacterium]|nr:YihY/virulence factor BrkB family protein [Actinomycetota bacterium]
MRDRLARSVLGDLWRRAEALNLATLSLALAAQQMLCTAPLLVAFSVVARRTKGASIGPPLARYLGLSHRASDVVVGLFAGKNSVSNFDTVVGLGLGLLFATGVASTQQRGYELIWSRPRPEAARAVLRQMLWVVGLCVYVLVVFYAGGVGRRVGDLVEAGQPAGPLVQFLVSALFFWWGLHLLLSGQVRWLHLLPSALFGALGMSALVALSGPLMSSQLVSQVHDYGLLGATFVLSLWLVALSTIVFGSTFLGAALADRRGWV